MSENLFIAYSNNFNNYNKFEKRLNNILKNLDDVYPVVFNDNNRLAERYFGFGNYYEYTRSLSNSHIVKALSECEYVVLFWDGGDITEYVYNSLSLKKNVRIIPVVTTKVVNKDKGEKFDVYIGRGSNWGNPFAIGDNGMTREDVINEYKKYFKEKFLNDTEQRKLLLSLKGKTLGCHCKPAACHGDVIADFLNSNEK